MEWQDEGTVLSVRTHGENNAIVEAFTPGHGRHAGVVRGGSSRKLTPVLQPGAQVQLSWRARLEAHLGAFTVEPLRSRSTVMNDRLALKGLNAVTGLLSFVLPERAAYPKLYEQTQTVLDLLGNTHWPLAYVQWELAVLEEMGFGLDLTQCAVTGATEGLAYVSPKTGRAVSEAGAGEWADRLLPLPPCLLGEVPQTNLELRAALSTTGFFFENKLRAALGERPLPPARGRLLEALRP